MWSLWHLPGQESAEPSPKPTVSPGVWILVPLVSIPAEISLPCCVLFSACSWNPKEAVLVVGIKPDLPSPCAPVLPHAHSETVNHPELLTSFVILNRAWTQLSRGESTMSYCNSFCQPILSWTQQYFNLKIQPQNPQHFQLLYFITTQLKTTLFFFNHPCFSKVNHKPWSLTDRKDPETNPLSLSWGL